MTPEQFAYWLQGFSELGGTPTQEQWDVIRAHLATVFDKKTTDLGFTVSPVDYNRNLYNPNPGYNRYSLIC